MSNDVPDEPLESLRKAVALTTVYLDEAAADSGDLVHLVSSFLDEHPIGEWAGAAEMIQGLLQLVYSLALDLEALTGRTPTETVRVIAQQNEESSD